MSSLSKEAVLTSLNEILETLDNIKGDINPERGYCDELEEDLSVAYYKLCEIILDLES